MRVEKTQTEYCSSSNQRENIAWGVGNFTALKKVYPISLESSWGVSQASLQEW